MKSATRGAWQFFRGFLLIACAGGILAADNSWISSVDFDFAYPASWFSTLPPNDSRLVEVALPAPREINPRAQLSMGHLINGLLFSRPGHSWMLDPLAEESRSHFGGRITEFDPINQIHRSDDLGGFSAPGNFKTIAASYTAAITGPVITPDSPTSTDGTWTSNASGNWGTAANWQSNVIADGAGATAHFDLTNISSDVTVNLDTSRTIRNLYIGDTDATNHYTISPLSGSTLTFDPISTSFLDPSILQQRSTSAGDTIAANIFFKNDLQINNLSASHQFTISGNIASSGANGSSHSLEFNASGAAGDILVSGNISNGNTGATIFLGVDHGTVTLTGTNTYTGGSEVFGGTLLINGDNSAANGQFYVDNSGTLGGHGIIGSDVDVFGGKITGDTTTTVGTLTMNSLTLGGEGGATYIANLSGTTSDLLAITQTLTIFSGTGLQIVGAADNIHTYVLATFASHSGTFDPALVTGIPSGYTLVYNPTDMELVPTAIPEPATWIGGALALGAMGFIRRRQRRLKDRSLGAALSVR